MSILLKNLYLILAMVRILPSLRKFFFKICIYQCEFLLAGIADYDHYYLLKALQLKYLILLDNREVDCYLAYLAASDLTNPVFLALAKSILLNFPFML